MTENKEETVEIQLLQWKPGKYIDIRIFYTSDCGAKEATIDAETLPHLITALKTMKSSKIAQEEKRE